jgi:hypothetical protein
MLYEGDIEAWAATPDVADGALILATARSVRTYR